MPFDTTNFDYTKARKAASELADTQRLSAFILWDGKSGFKASMSRSEPGFTHSETIRPR